MTTVGNVSDVYDIVLYLRHRVVYEDRQVPSVGRTEPVDWSPTGPEGTGVTPTGGWQGSTGGYVSPKRSHPEPSKPGDGRMR